MRKLSVLLFSLLIVLPATGQDGITFKVETLSKPKYPLFTEPLEDVYKNLIRDDITPGYRQFPMRLVQEAVEIPFGIICNSDMPDRLVTYGYHSFFDGMYRAYADHRPFVLSPDMIWLLISQGFAAHVRANPEGMRDHFVDFTEKMSLVVVSDEVPLDAPADKWESIFPRFVELMSENTKGDIIDILSADFSTTTPVERVASQITIMNAMDPYFAFIVIMVGCGIPEITLKGTTEDWQQVLDKARRLEQYDLKWWTSELIPLLEQFVRASKGKVDKKFWREMFKYHTPDGLYPPDIIDGWIVKFFPYDKDGRRNDLVSVNKGMGGHNLPKEIAKVDLKHIEVHPGGEEVTTPLELWAGFIGLEQDEDTYALTPQIGWMIRKKDVENVGLQRELESQNQKGSISIRVKEVPPALLNIPHIEDLEIQFIDKIVIPDGMKRMKIDRLILRGIISDEETEHIKNMFPESGLKINGNTINDKNGIDGIRIL
jgi:hypothetical protein